MLRRRGDQEEEEEVVDGGLVVSVNEDIELDIKNQMVIIAKSVLM